MSLNKKEFIKKQTDLLSDIVRKYRAGKLKIPRYKTKSEIFGMGHIGSEDATPREFRSISIRSSTAKDFTEYKDGFSRYKRFVNSLPKDYYTNVPHNLLREVLDNEWVSKRGRKKSIKRFVYDKVREIESELDYHEIVVPLHSLTTEVEIKIGSVTILPSDKVDFRRYKWNDWSSGGVPIYGLPDKSLESDFPTSAIIKTKCYKKVVFEYSRTILNPILALFTFFSKEISGEPRGAIVPDINGINYVGFTTYYHYSESKYRRGKGRGVRSVLNEPVGPMNIKKERWEKFENSSYGRKVIARLKRGNRDILDNRVINSLEWYFEAMKTSNLNNKYGMIFIALELLLAPGESECVNTGEKFMKVYNRKLTKRLEFLCKDIDNVHVKIALSKYKLQRGNKYYSEHSLKQVRHDLFHKGKNDIAKEQVRELKALYTQVLIKLLSLRKFPDKLSDLE